VTSADVVAGVDWGGTWIRAALAQAGDLVVQIRQRRPDGVDEQVDLVCELIDGLAARLGRPASRLGVGIAGIIRHGRVESASNLGIRDPYDLERELRERTGLPVILVNDAQAAAVAESARLGPGTAVLLTIGTGIGGAIVADGRLVLGEGAAGDFGHLVIDADGPECACGARGCLEQMVSGRVLDQDARDLAESGASPWLTALASRRRSPKAAGRSAGSEEHASLDATDLDAAAQAGDTAAITTLERAAGTLVTALRSVTAAIDPAAIVLGGGVMTPGRLLPRLVRERWAEQRPRWSAAELRPALLDPDAGLRGAALLAGGSAGVWP
jgi:glucokinase